MAQVNMSDMFVPQASVAFMVKPPDDDETEVAREGLRVYALGGRLLLGISINDVIWTEDYECKMLTV